MGEQLKNPPVYFVIGQVRFNEQPVVIRDNLHQIQEGFRQLGYVDFQTKALEQTEIVIEGAQVKNHRGESIVYFDFANIERSELFRLEAHQLSFHTVNYHTFTTFVERFEKALGILMAHAQIELVERVGLRFLNAVLRQEGEEIATYLHPQLLGFSALSNGFEVRYSGTETLMIDGSDFILARVVIHQGRVGFPVDLSNTGLEIAERFREYKGPLPLAILDNDAFNSERLSSGKSMSTEIMQTFGRLKTMVDAVFMKSATERAFSIWRGEA